MPQHTEELFNKQAIAMFCELHKRMLNTLCEAELKDSTHQVIQDAQTLTEALNALEAVVRSGNAAIFYETVCNPSASARSRELAERYERKEFAKRAMMRSIFGSSFQGDEALMDEADAELDELLGKATGFKRKGGASSQETRVLVAAVAAVAALVLVSGYGIYWVLQ